MISLLKSIAISALFVLLSFHVGRAQFTITFSADGKMISKECCRNRSNTTVLVIQAPDSDFSYVVNYLDTPETSYSTDITTEGTLIFFKASGPNKTCEIVSTEDLNYQVYRFPSSFDNGSFRDGISSLQQLKAKIIQQGNNVLSSARTALVDFIHDLRYPAAEVVLDSLNSYRDIEQRIKILERELGEVKKSADSLTSEQSADYKLLLRKRLTLRATLTALLDALHGAARVRNANPNKLLNLIESTRNDLLVIEDSLNHYRIVKQFFKVDRVKEIENKIKLLKSKLGRLEIMDTFDDFISRYRAVDKTLAYKIEMLHAGKTNRDDIVHWVDYQPLVDDKNDIVGATRMHGQLPVLDEFHFLGVHLVNTPIEKFNNGSPVIVEIGQVNNVFPVDRFGGIRMETDAGGLSEGLQQFFDANSTLVQIDRMVQREKERESKRAASPNFLYVPFSGFQDPRCNLTNTRIQDIRDVCNVYIVAGGARPKSEVIRVLEMYRALIQAIQHLGSSSADITYANSFIDYHFYHGTRFNHGTAPTITIKKLAAKSEDQKVLIADKLEPIQKTYWFGISTGIVVTGIKDYSYRREFIDGSNKEQVIEREFLNYTIQPVALLSFYFKGQRLDRKPKWATTVNVGVGYVKPLENFYFGLGFEPMRHVQLNIGARLAKIQHVSDSYNPYNLDYESSLQDEWRFGYYVGANFYLKAITQLIQTVFTKP